ncbi:DUF6807 family protein [Prosthecobacter sp. SYSU 5D2]|uniref:DUF6807 family protein n=1 Tax=Prosthecobacter sp. SYSU 5D2 TaxID=3134134 RepID=UPI0031FEB9EB
MSNPFPTSGRRRFLTGALAMAAGSTAAREAGPGAFVVEDQRPFKDQTRRLKITREGRPVAALLFPTDYPTHFRLKPELHNVCTPTGVPVTGSHEHAFIHHQSIMCGHGRVQVDGDGRVVDFYRQLPFADGGRADRWHSPTKNLFQLGPSGIQHVTEARWRAADQVVIQLDLAWQTREAGRATGDVLAREERLYRLMVSDGCMIVDVFSKLQAAGAAVTLHPENDHGYLGVRVHDLIDVEDGGVMGDSEGRKNPSEHFRAATGAQRAPRWVDCTGRMGNATVGMALMSHPANVRNEWYVREFGLMIVSAAQSEAVRITPETPFEFAARFVAHDGVLPPEAADQLQARFAAVTADELRAFLKA